MNDIESFDTVRTVGDLRLWSATIDLAAPTLSAEQMMQQDSQLPGIVVQHQGQLVALLSRRLLFQQLSRPMGREIFLKRPVSEMLDAMDRTPLVLRHDMPIATAVEVALSRDARMVYEPVLVETPGQSRRVLAIDLLLRVQSVLLDMAMQAKNRLLDEVQRTAGELRTALDELGKARDHLVHSEKMVALGQLVAGIAHEINTPIGVALTAATHLAERTTTFNTLFTAGQMKRSDLQSYVGLATQSTELLRFNIQRAAQLIQSFKQVAVDQASEQRRSFDLGQYLEQLVTSLRPEGRKLGHNIGLSCPPGIAMNAYPGALAQALSNLTSNALVHAYPEDVRGEIRLIVRSEGNHVVIDVEDDGQGIPAEHLSRIYDPFFTTRRGSGGSGLGLHIVYNIVTEKLHGSITCRSAPGQGSVFTITMPQTVAE